MLKVLLPIILPIAIEELPCVLATMLTKSSGEDVPNATIERPMTRSETPSFLVSEEAPLTSRSAPSTSTGKPTMRRMYINIGVYGSIGYGPCRMSI
jgi:hypothetical protein